MLIWRIFAAIGARIARDNPSPREGALPLPPPPHPPTPLVRVLHPPALHAVDPEHRDPRGDAHFLDVVPQFPVNGGVRLAGAVDRKDEGGPGKKSRQGEDSVEEERERGAGADVSVAAPAP